MVISTNTSREGSKNKIKIRKYQKMPNMESYIYMKYLNGILFLFGLSEFLCSYFLPFSIQFWFSLRDCVANGLVAGVVVAVSVLHFGGNWQGI
jgi:hypothetical protein